MRLTCLAFRALIALAALATGAPAAHAQSFFQKLLGSGSSSGPSQRPGPVPSLRTLNRYSPYGSDGSSPYIVEDRPQSEAGGYRTLCVRMCDGYYWPISSSVSRGKLYRDARLCQADCQTEARLFYLPRASDDTEHMTDLSGRAYGRLPTAFVYRKALIAGCTCRPRPWAESELARHRAYASIEDMKRQRGGGATEGPEAPRPAPPRIADGPAAEPQTAEASSPGRAPSHVPPVETPPVETGALPDRDPAASAAVPTETEIDAQMHAWPPAEAVLVTKPVVWKPGPSGHRTARPAGGFARQARWLSRPKAKYLWPGVARARHR